MYTLAITSCGRHDLLRRTLDSFFKHADVLPDEVVIIEDSDTPEPEWLEPLVNAASVPSLQWINNAGRQGQLFSIDRLYSQITTSLIFHCEDDWEFVDGPFIQKSIDTLEAHPEVLMVSLRGKSWNHPLIDRNGLKIAEPGWMGGWGGLAFNPGMRRLSDYQRIGTFGKHVGYNVAGCKHELELSKMYLKLGYVIADSGHVYVKHIGEQRSKARLDLPNQPKILIAIPACAKLEYGEHGLPAFHRDGPNDRVAAVRETWAQDVQAFRNVDLRFFFGQAVVNEVAKPDDSVGVLCPDDYDNLPFKTINLCKFAEQYGYDFIFKCDDDTAVYVDRLFAELAANKDMDYGGWVNGGACSGGPGYWLSRRAAEYIAASTPSHWAEDVCTGAVLSKAGIKPRHLPAHHPGFRDHHYFPNGFNHNKNLSKIVAFHSVQPDVMRAWYAVR